ncbi:hypothetical protein F5Y00DRAFT_257675 [Daldinia vernicosa]|uniref:uncharacterized protein n=1 Tax=Daldinia vernicosa TaxID=114800 RepID=UPI0020072DD6|nr:uncharacterized protein F5Y00DRAFT_257675 [Daldinia vernicosa]KAI0853020.1 hypothetical protein F5Y00DRAFT_257675 [Daldinia vernicosa]
MLEITHWLRSGFDTACKAASGHIPESKSPPPVERSQGQDTSQTNVAKKRKYSNKGSDGGEEDDNGSGQDQRPIKKGVDGKKHQKQMFACPYFKHNPSKYKEWRTYPGPGWLDVHRVKEHLYRRHRQPSFRCGRCWEPFESEGSYLDHQRMIEPCALKDKELIEWFDNSQEKQLKLRKSTSDMSETEKWRTVFSILFPDVRKEDIPTPFYDYDHVAKIVPNQLEQLAACEEYILREIPLRLQQRLRPELDRDFNTVEESLKRTATYCVRGLLVDAFREFRQIQQCKMIPRTEYEDTGMIDDRFGHTLVSQGNISQCCQSTSIEQASSVGFDFGLRTIRYFPLEQYGIVIGRGFHNGRNYRTARM